MYLCSAQGALRRRREELRVENAGIVVGTGEDVARHVDDTGLRRGLESGDVGPSRRPGPGTTRTNANTAVTTATNRQPGPVTHLPSMPPLVQRDPSRWSQPRASLGTRTAADAGWYHGIGSGRGRERALPPQAESSRRAARQAAGAAPPLRSAPRGDPPPAGTGRAILAESTASSRHNDRNEPLEPDHHSHHRDQSHARETARPPGVILIPNCVRTRCATFSNGTPNCVCITRAT